MLASNRTKVELKLPNLFQQSNHLGLLIVPKWNWNNYIVADDLEDKDF